MLFVAKTVQKSELPETYGFVSADGTLLDEYDRAATPLIHSLDVETGDIRRIGLNNSHQFEPLSLDGPGGNRLVVFTQWEHQQTTNSARAVPPLPIGRSRARPASWFRT
jgi:hypothetical protein